MRSAAFILFASFVGLPSCDQKTQVLSEDDVALVRNTFPTITKECVERAKREGFEALNGPTDRCFPMQRQREWVGLWVNEFEGSRFCPAPATECKLTEYGTGTYLTFSEGQRPVSVDRFQHGAIFQIRFIGRKTQESGSFGHMGVNAHEIIVDRLISLQPRNINSDNVAR